MYPMTGYLVAGTQAEKKKQNFVIFVKMSQLNQTKQDEDGKWSSIFPTFLFIFFFLFFFLLLQQKVKSL